jgi:hypothetical protein
VLKFALATDMKFHDIATNYRIMTLREGQIMRPSPIMIAKTTVV